MGDKIIKSCKCKLIRFIEFCLCLYFFPSGIKIIKFLSTIGLHTTTEKFFLYITSKNLSVEGDILEIGSYMGSSSVLLAAGNRLSRNKGKVWLIEPLPRPNKAAFLNVLSSRGMDKDVILIDKTNTKAEDAVDSMLRFIFIDGNHEYEHVKKDISIWRKRLAEGGIIAFHDINEKGVARAVNELIEKSGEFSVLGVIANTLYASRGAFKDNNLVSRLRRLNTIREKCIKLAR